MKGGFRDCKMRHLAGRVTPVRRGDLNASSINHDLSQGGERAQLDSTVAHHSTECSDRQGRAQGAGGVADAAWRG
jgi:hypothetical protein